MSHKNIVRFVKAQRVQRLGQLEWTDDQRMPKKFLRAQVYKSRKRRRSRMRWLDDMLENLRRMDVNCYAEMATGRRHWRRFVSEARTHVRL